MKERLDIVLVQRKLAASREKAKSIIMEGLVYVNGQKSDKPGTPVKEDDQIEIRGEVLRYVSRGGKKLEKAMQVFPIQLDGRVCIDIGASTGGFTDCMLQNGAVKVYSVDVGYGQLAWSLRNDPRVVNLERTNIRYITEEQVPELVDFISVDVSFISLTLVLPVAWRQVITLVVVQVIVLLVTSPLLYGVLAQYRGMLEGRPRPVRGVFRWYSDLRLTAKALAVQVILNLWRLGCLKDLPHGRSFAM